jgi:hypothetical protein
MKPPVQLIYANKNIKTTRKKDIDQIYTHTPFFCHVLLMPLKTVNKKAITRYRCMILQNCELNKPLFSIKLALFKYFIMVMEK